MPIVVISTELNNMFLAAIFWNLNQLYSGFVTVRVALDDLCTITRTVPIEGLSVGLLLTWHRRKTKVEASTTTSSSLHL